jgi:hypothetical protein
MVAERARGFGVGFGNGAVRGRERSRAAGGKEEKGKKRREA